MSINSISLLAQNIYGQIQNRPKITVNEEVKVQTASDFQKLVKKQFNSFAAMSPQQILSHIQSNKASALNLNHDNATSNLTTNALLGIKTSLNKHESIVRKSLINEASLIDVLTATTEATNTMKLVVSFREKFMESFDKVMNMTM